MRPRPRVVLVNRFYWPDVAATAQMLTDLAEDMAAAGWQVTVVTGRAGYDRPDDPLCAAEDRAGVQIHRVWSSRFGRGRLPGRLLDAVSFLVGAAIRLARLPAQDVVVAMTDPPLLLGVAWLVGRLRGWRVVHWAQDLFPELAVRLGVLRDGGAAHRISGAVARGLHARVDLTVALGTAMAESLLAAGAARDRLVVAHNWADGRAITPTMDARAFVESQALHGRFIVLYAGNAGRAHAFDAVLGAMRRLREDPTIAFVFVGGGAQMPALRAAAARERLPNARFLPYQPRESLGGMLTAAGVSLVTEDDRVAGLLVPCKTYGILASGRPLVFLGSARSDVARLVTTTGCGWTLPPGDTDALVRAIQAARDDPALAAAMGARGRRALESLYDRPLATARWMAAVHTMLVTHEVSA